MNKKRVLFSLIVAFCFSLMISVNSNAEEKSYTNQDLKILAAIVSCEAGNQSYAGKLAVACVIVNRKNSSAFPNTIKGVVYQKGQFSPTRTGKMNKELKKYSAGKYKYGYRAQCLKAAKAALEGQTYVVTKGKKINMKRYHFFSGSLSKAKLKINGHQFK